MKNTKKIALAAMSLVAAGVAAAGATGTFAWFSMNNKVSVDGMVIKTAVSNNLLIDSYSAGNWATNDSSFKANLTQGITTNNTLVPVSTVDGINFFYVDPANIAGNGDAASDAYIAYSTLSALQEKYPLAEAAYLDYHFVLKADNTSDDPQKINVAKLDLTYTPAAAEEDANNAFRVAVLAKEFTTATVNGSKTAPGLPAAATKIYAPADADNFEDNKAVASTSATGAVTYAAAAADSTIATVAANSTKYYEVTVRLWLEGEDETCTVETFKNLTDGSWALDVDFMLEADTSHGVYELSMLPTRS